MSDKLRILYIDDVPRTEKARAFKANERFTVRDIRSAKRLHPGAVIERYDDGRRYTGPGSLAAFAETGERIGDVLLKDADAYEEPVTPPDGGTPGDGPETSSDRVGGAEGGDTPPSASEEGDGAPPDPTAAESGGKKKAANGRGARTG